MRTGRCLPCLSRAAWQGRGSFTMQFERYEAVPFIVTEQIIERRRAANKIR